MLHGTGEGEIKTKKNTAGLGAVMALVNIDCQAIAAELAQNIRHIDLAQDQALSHRFAMATMFPERPGE